MMIRYHLEKLLQFLVDGVYASIPRSRPPTSALRNCKIVSHRGEHDNKAIKENTITAFDRVLDRGIWGIEFDIHWTSDLQPVVLHDLDCRRVFGSTLEVNKVTLSELQSAIPEIPSLDQIIQRYGKKIHLMVEIKQEIFPDPQYQQARLKKLFSSLEPGTDFHILALGFNIRAFSEKALEGNYAGISGQYLLIGENTIRKHGRRNQKTGTGFAGSRFCFYRELNRGVEWIFTNHALKLHKIQQELLTRILHEGNEAQEKSGKQG